jgi:RNA polymerase sigma-70 factor (ECF subfamily)
MASGDRPGPPADRPADEASDHSLLGRLRRGSQDAAAALYRRYSHRLRALAKAQFSAELARRVEVDDIVQSVFGSFFRGASQGYYDVPAGEELWKLFLVIALNKIRAKGAYHRAAKRDAGRTVGGNALAPDAVSDDDTAAESFLQLVIDEALERLPEPHRQMVRLRIEGYEVAEIARATARSKRSVERVLQDFRRHLAEVLYKDSGP